MFHEMLCRGQLLTPLSLLQIQVISSLVNKTQSPKQVELMATILADVDKLDFNSLYNDDIARWLEAELKDVVRPPPPTSSPSPTDLTPSPTTNVEVTDTSHENEIVEENSQENVEGEDDGEDSEKEDEAAESEDPNISKTDNRTGSGARMGAFDALLFVLIVLVCAMR